jgi:hypothetical protein
MSKLKQRLIVNDGENVAQVELSCVTYWWETTIKITLKNCLAVSYKDKYMLT